MLTSPVNEIKLVVFNITIIFTRYSEPDNFAHEHLTALEAQIGVTGEIIFLDQKPSAQMKLFVDNKTFGSLTARYVECEARGLSFARNKGLKCAKFELVLFTDPDTIPSRSWAYWLAHTLKKGELDEVAIVGGRCILHWCGGRPWLAGARPVADVLGDFHLSDDVCEVDAVVGMSMALNLAVAGSGKNGRYFSTNLGRMNGNLMSGEDTEICYRYRMAGKKILYEPRSITAHRVTPDRAQLSWIMRRLVYGGYSRAMIGNRPRVDRISGVSQLTYLPFILPPWAIGFMAGMIRRLVNRK